MRGFLAAALCTLLAPATHADLTSACGEHRLIEKSAPVSTGADSFLWAVHAPGGGTSYLIGTFHSNSPELRTKWEALPLLFAGMRELLSETDFGPESGRKFSALSRSTDDMFSGFDSGLSTEASRLLTSYGITDLSLKPWAAFLTLSAPAAPSIPLDAIIAKNARAAGLTVRPLQTIEEMIASMETLTPDDQRNILADTVCNYAALQKQTAELERLYLADDAPGFQQQAERLQTPHTELGQRMSDALLTSRNRVFVSRARESLAAGGAVIAAGASHLVGNEGLVAQLTVAGFQLEPMKLADASRGLIATANGKVAGVGDELAGWLKQTGYDMPAGYKAPVVKLATRAEIAATGCEDDDGECEVAATNGALLVSLADASPLLRGEPNLKSVLLGYILRDVQNRQPHVDNSCVYWNQKNVEGVILRSRYLAAHGTASAGLRPLPNPVCTP
jgi:uncharacterized protein YbaP (TraB family)